MAKTTLAKLSISKKSIIDKQAFLKDFLELPVEDEEEHRKRVERLRKVDSWTEEPSKLDASYLSKFEK